MRAALLAVAGLLASCTSDASTSRRVVLTQDAACRAPFVGIAVEAPCWTPDAATAERAATALPAYLRISPRFAEQQSGQAQEDYWIQYFGASAEGRPVIVANAFCRDPGPNFDRHAFSPPLDGGACYFRAVYDPATGAYIALQVNGEA